MPSILDDQDPRYDMPEPAVAGKEGDWALEALQRVLADKPERLDWREVDNAAVNERHARISALSKESAQSLIPRPDLHRQMDHLLDEIMFPPTSESLTSTQPRSEFSREMESTND